MVYGFWKCADLEQVAVHWLSVQRGIDIDLSIGVVDCLDFKNIFHVASHQSEVHLRESKNFVTKATKQRVERYHYNLLWNNIVKTYNAGKWLCSWMIVLFLTSPFKLASRSLARTTATLLPSGVFSRMFTDVSDVMSNSGLLSFSSSIVMDTCED